MIQQREMRVFSDDAANQSGTEPSNSVRNEFFQRIKRPSAKKQSRASFALRARAITGHRDITGCNSFRALPRTATGANGAKKSAVSADSIFIDTGKQLGRIYYFTRARAPFRARCCFCLLSRIQFYTFARRLYIHTAFHTADIFECPFEWPLYFASYR